MNRAPSLKPDLISRDCIKQLVDAFYDRVRKDEVIGFIFNDVAKTDWGHHLPRMYDFWQKVMFRSGPFQGDPLAVHAALAQRTTMGKAQFERWLSLFCETVDERFYGPNATHIKNAAADMAAVIHRKINGLPHPVTMVKPSFSPDSSASIS